MNTPTTAPTSSTAPAPDNVTPAASSEDMRLPVIGWRSLPKNLVIGKPLSGAPAEL